MSVNSLCWDCKNAVCKCPWSKNFEPVPGWVATPKKIKNSDDAFLNSYLVISCPLFKRDEEFKGFEEVSVERMGELLGEKARVVARIKQEQLINKCSEKGYYLYIKRDSHNKRIYYIKSVTPTGKYITSDVAKLFNIHIGFPYQQPKAPLPKINILR